METPQELEVWYIIPAIRKELSLSMKDKGMKQVEIANRLGVTKSAVNQYINNKRAGHINFNKKIKDQINNSAKLIEDKIDSMREMQRILELARKENVICELHRKLDKDFESCNVCQELKLITVGARK